MHEIVARIGRRRLAAAVALTITLVVLLSTPQLLGSHVASAFGALDHGDPLWLWLAGTGFLLAVLGAAGSWLSAIRLCGGRLSIGDACARYGAGSLVNTFVPFRAGDAVRIGLFSRMLPRSKERVWTTGGAFAALGLARLVVLAGFVVAGTLAGALPVWSPLAALAVVAAGIALTLRTKNGRDDGRLSHLLDAFRALRREPLAALRLVGWIALSTAGRLTAATAVGAAMEIHRPFVAALVIVPALDVAGTLPILPANVGVTSGAVAVAFQAHGISFAHGLAAGIAFHAVETTVGILFGLVSVVWLAPYPSPHARRIALVAVAASGCLAIAGTFSATVLVPLV